MRRLLYPLALAAIALAAAALVAAGTWAITENDPRPDYPEIEREKAER